VPSAQSRLFHQRKAGCSISAETALLWETACFCTVLAAATASKQPSPGNWQQHTACARLLLDLWFTEVSASRTGGDDSARPTASKKQQQGVIWRDVNDSRLARRA
jgi:hypothetical protein